ncbi:hypothetical protein EOM39_05285 [Candidatus Gracilibacteria bacterium]|nr:hypothetical protein [Candidatus Gracilibacteria bacterium]
MKFLYLTFTIYYLTTLSEMYPKLVLSEDKSPFVSKRWKEKQSIKFDISFTYIIMIAFIFLLLIYYIWIINANATKGFSIRQLEQEKKNLLIEKEQLEVKIANLESIDGINDENMDSLENMEKVENPDYLVIKEGVNYVYND